jgi:hypothetical protein
VTVEQTLQYALETEPETGNFHAEALPPDVLAQIVR